MEVVLMRNPLLMYFLSDKVLRAVLVPLCGLPCGRGSGQVLMAPVLLVTTLRWTVASLARCTPPTPHRLD